MSSIEREMEHACFQDWTPGKAVGPVTEIRVSEGREGSEGSVLNSVFGLLSLSSEESHVCRWREIRWKRAFEIGIGDMGSGVIA